MATPIKCTNHTSKQGNGQAKFACLECSRYLCQSCDQAAHAKAKHHRFPVETLKSFIVFDKKEGESHVRRSLGSPGGPLNIPFNGCTTAYETFQRSVKQFASRPCMGVRSFSQGKPGSYVWENYAQIGARVLNFANGLRQLGIQPKVHFGLYSANRPEWVIAEQAGFCFSMLPVPLYDTLGADAAEYVIREAQLEFVVCTSDKLDNLHQITKTCAQLKLAIVMPDYPWTAHPKDATKKPAATSPLKIVTFAEVEQLGAKSSTKAAHVPPSPQDLFTLCYTSGTTGAPKGAMLTHENFVSNIAGVVLHGLKALPEDVHISFLPLAHVFERLCQGFLLGSGSAMAFSRGDPLVLLEDIAEARPTLFIGVPRLYNRLYDKILSTISATGGVTKFMFDRAYNAKKRNLYATGAVTSAVWDRLVFSKIAARLGGRVRLFVTGSAPISTNVIEFLRICFSCQVVEGYGQTEGTSGETVMPIDDTRCFGNVGVPVQCNEIKLVDVVEMNYTSKDVINGIPSPRGEIWVRGPNVFKGYYKAPDKTAETLENGWLKSGDIGMWLADGTLKIIDRKKNIFKLAQGEYIAPEKIENVYQKSKFVAQIFVYGDSLQMQLVAIVVPDEEELKAWAQKKNIAWESLAKAVQNPEVNAVIFQDMTKIGKEGQLRGFEVVKAIHLFGELFSVQNGLLTPTFKLKRNEARDKFRGEIDRMYAQLNQAAEKEKKNAPQIPSRL